MGEHHLRGLGRRADPGNVEQLDVELERNEAVASAVAVRQLEHQGFSLVDQRSEGGCRGDVRLADSGPFIRPRDLGPDAERRNSERHSVPEQVKGRQGMREQTRTGLWVAYGGVASKLVGLTWDAVLHSLDPNLAATEGIFTLVNPSHSLITLGLGHGLVANVDADNPKALRFCDALPGDWDRSSCYGGVFMENIMIEWHLRFGAPADGGGHVHYTQKSMLREDDPLYPCNAVAEKYRRECYFIQTSAISMFNDNDFRATAQACDRAPSKHIPTCYQSLGRDISGFTLRDPQRSVDLCLLGDDRYEGHCITGVVREIINFSWRTDDGFAFCSTVPEASRALCYKGVGEHVDSLFPDRAQKASECARAPEAYRASCDEGARLVRQS